MFFPPRVTTAERPDRRAWAEVVIDNLVFAIGLVAVMTFAKLVVDPFGWRAVVAVISILLISPGLSTLKWWLVGLWER